jgi:hypothetical protein
LQHSASAQPLWQLTVVAVAAVVAVMAAAVAAAVMVAVGTAAVAAAIMVAVGTAAVMREAAGTAATLDQ